MNRPPDRDIAPTPDGAGPAEAVAAFLGDDAAAQRFWLVSRTGSRVEVPAELAELLHDAAATLAAGGGVGLRALPPRLRLAQGAELAGMSVERLRAAADTAGYRVQGKLGAEHLGLAEVLDLKRAERQRRENSLREMVAEAEESGLYDVDGRDT